jgi:N-acetylmuramoyl-L-alanine amidase
MVVLIDNGHGANTAGKRSPKLDDGRQLLEYQFAREVASVLQKELEELGVKAILVTPETTDVTLKERCKRINQYCTQYGTAKCLAVSIHCNAAGSDGAWHDAHGWSVYVSNNASYNSKALATKLAEAADGLEVKVRRPTARQNYWTQNLAICRDTKCAAVLTENMFMDNQTDCQWLLSEEGKNTIVALHVEGILEYIKSKEG